MMDAARQASREHALTEAFVGLADTLVTDYDVIELLHRLCRDSVTLLQVAATGLLLTDQRGALRVVSSSSEKAHLVELFQVQADEGPCLDCFGASQQVTSVDLEDEARWPRFTRHALQAGYRAVHALPMRLRMETIGALNLFMSTPGGLSAEDLRLGQALADVATIGILQERAIRRQEMFAEQLQAALNSRVVIEQAKGMLAERGKVGMDRAFSLLRGYARANGQRLSDVARDLVNGAVRLDDVLAAVRKKR